MDSFKSKEEDVKAFAAYLQSTVQLDNLEKMTSALDQELSDSQQMMTDIKALYNSITNNTEPVETNLRHEDLSKFLEAPAPNLLMRDMDDNTPDVDLDDVIASLKGYAEDLKMNLKITESTERETSKKEDLGSLDLEQYALSLDQLGKRLANIKLSKKENVKNVELEEKLSRLCQDVNLFMQVVEAKSTLSEHNKNWTETRQDNSALCYNDIVNKLLAGINEVTYLLQNKN